MAQDRRHERSGSSPPRMKTAAAEPTVSELGNEQDDEPDQHHRPRNDAAAITRRHRSSPALMPTRSRPSKDDRHRREADQEERAHHRHGPRRAAGEIGMPAGAPRDPRATSSGPSERERPDRSAAGRLAGGEVVLADRRRRHEREGNEDRRQVPPPGGPECAREQRARDKARRREGGAGGGQVHAGPREDATARQPSADSRGPLAVRSLLGSEACSSSVAGTSPGLR